MKQTRLVIGLIATVLSPIGSLAMDEPDPAEILFAFGSVLELTIEADFDYLRKEINQDRSVYQPGILVVEDLSGVTRSLPVSLKTRGVSRLKMGICSFVQFFVQFKDSGLVDTPFSGQKTLPLVTHCKNTAKYEQYLLKEFLAYQTYALLTDASIRTRLARITYVDTSGKRKDLVRYAFFAEHFEQVAQRLGRELVSIGNFNPLNADPYGSALMDVFQYMIGNTDWSVVQQHNVALLQDSSGGILPLPFDFDWTGVVDASYAYPGDEVNINSVRQRLYRGACLGQETMQEVFDRFVTRKEGIYAMYRKQAGLDARQLKKTLGYYDEFYKTITTPKEREKKILAACRRFETP
jgi:hypothetical protein